MRFAINRLDLRGPHEFAASAARAEGLGWSMGLIPCSPLLVHDPYVMLAFAAGATASMRLGTMLDTPVIRHPAALASSIATVAKLAPGRALLGLGIGDTAVRLNGLAPAKVADLERAIVTTRGLLAGDSLEVGAARPARLRHAAHAPVWVAAQGPKTLAMAGAVSDGVFIRVGRHPENLSRAYAAVVDGARAAGRNPADIEIGLIVHTIPCDDAARARRIGKAVAAGFYEYSPFLFDAPRLVWSGASAQTLKATGAVWPDFHHARDLDTAAEAVAFLDDEAADAFALHGSWETIAAQLDALLDTEVPVTTVLPHPMVPPGLQMDYVSAFSTHLFDRF